MQPGIHRDLSLREAPPGGATKQSSWIATARFAHLAMTIGGFRRAGETSIMPLQLVA
jgi:hypothetical protein